MNARNPFRPLMGLLLLAAWGCGGGRGAPAEAGGPAALTVTSSSPAALVRSPVTITANLLKADGSPVATGTAVGFAATGGGVLTNVTTTNASGNATATLTSAVKGTVTVTATVGSLPTKTESVAFIDPTLAIVKLRTTGTLPAGTTIGGVNAIVSASPSAGLAITASDHAVSGAGAGSLLVANANDVAADNLAVINSTGIQTGEFATLTYHLNAGRFAAASDFSVAPTGPGVIDTAGVTIPGAGVGILSVTVQ
jgi:adhesin/invasin